MSPKTLLIAIALTGCGGGASMPPLPPYQCHPKNFGVVASEVPIDCNNVQKNVDLAYLLFDELDISENFTVPVIVRKRAHLAKTDTGYIQGMTHWLYDAVYIELTIDAQSLFHELCHVHSSDQGDHRDWVRLGYMAKEKYYESHCLYIADF
jgi:hypothetical protein